MKKATKIKIEDYQLKDDELIVVFYANNLPRTLGIDRDRLEEFAKMDCEEAGVLHQYTELEHDHGIDGGNYYNVFDLQRYMDEIFDREKCEELLNYIM